MVSFNLMIGQLVASATSLIISIISSTGYLGIFALMTAESALIPIPSEVTMTFAGYIASTGKLNIYFVILIGALANVFGSWFAYWLGRWGEKEVVLRLIKNYGKYLLIGTDEFNRSERWYRSYGEIITFFSRVLPIVRTFISLPAGIAKMDFWRFTLFTFLGSLVWSALLAYVGYILGRNWNSLHPYYQKFEYVIIGVLAVFAVYYMYHKLRKMKS